MANAIEKVERPWSEITRVFQQMVRQPVDDLRQYNRRTLARDVVAGLTVAVVALPQSMAFALIAGVPPQYGLYGAMFQAVIGGLLSPSSHLSIGPTNTQSLLVAAAVHRISGSEDPAMFVQLAVFLTLVKGLVQIGFAAARMGGLVRYVSQSVIVGFTAGAGVLIAVGQLPNFLGVEPAGPQTDWPGVIDKMIRMVPALRDIHWTAVEVGAGSLVLVLICKRISKWIPGPLLAVTGTAALVWAMGWTDAHLQLVGKLPGGLPAFSNPWMGWSRAEQMLGGAVAIALLGMVESVAIGKSIANHTGQRISADQEFLAQGVTNVLTSFMQCIPGSGSFSRSALNYQVGAATRFAGLFCGVFVMIAFLLFAGQTRFIPMASLAAILFVVAWQLIDFQYLKQVMHGSRGDAGVCLFTFAATLVLPLEYAIYVGILLNIGLYIRQASRLHMSEMVAGRSGPFHEQPVSDRTGRKSVIFLSLEGDLFFGVSDELQDRLAQAAGSGVRVMILRLKRTHMMDATVMSVLGRFAQTMRERDGHVIFCGVRPELHRQMKEFGLVDIVGQANVFPTQVGVFASAKEAIARARELIGRSIDADFILQEEESERRFDNWAYQI